MPLRDWRLAAGAVALLVVGGWGCSSAAESGLTEFPEGECGPELCDGVDNDCDGETDEIGDLAAGGVVGVPCGTDEGICRTGIAGCEAGAPTCVGAHAPEAETCDGRDEDCDGETDERADLASAGLAGVPCGVEEGACERGILECVDAEAVCVGGTDPTTETCDGVDEDCDGETDEEAEGTCEPCVPEDGLGLCRSGVRLCEGGALTCAPHPPDIEAIACDLLDNDCDGVHDEAGEAPVAIEGRLAAAREACGVPDPDLGGLPTPAQGCSVDPREVGCLPVHACLPADCMQACRDDPGEGGLTACLQACGEGDARGALRWSCGGGEAGPACGALECAEGFRLDGDACVPDVEICNNGLDDDRDGLVDGTLKGPDPCAATVDARGRQLEFGACDPAENPACPDDERLLFEWDEDCVGEDCPFMVELTYAYAIDREEVSMRAYRECVTAGCCPSPGGRVWDYVDAIAEAGPLPPRPASPARCAPPTVIVPEGANPAGDDMPPGAVARDDPLLADLPVSRVSWCEARAYCAWAGKRLPTEYEWERAATGLGMRRKHSWGEDQPAACPELDCCRAPDFEFEGEPPAGCDPERLEIPICEQALPAQTRRRCLATYGAARGCADARLETDCPECIQLAAPVWANEDGASPLGVVNLNGNVLEWVYDWYRGGNFAGLDSGLDPIGRVCSTPDVPWKVQRGGAFADSPEQLSNISRRPAHLSMRSPTAGIRCARTLTESGDLCAPTLPEVAGRCTPQAPPCAAPDFFSSTPDELALCPDGEATYTAECPDPRDEYCGTDQVLGCDAYLVRSIQPRASAITKFVPPALLDAMGVDLQGLDLGLFDKSLDSALRAAMAPAGGDTLLALEIPSEVGQVDGRPRGRLGSVVVDDQGALRFLGLRRPADADADGDGDPVCVPGEVAELEYRSEEGSLDVRTICGMDRWELRIPEAVIGQTMSAVFIEAERTELGAKGAALVLASIEDGDLWAVGSPPVPGSFTPSFLGIPPVSLCELYDVLGCERKPDACPEGHMQPCPEDDRTCNGYILPIDIHLVRASRSGVPGLRGCVPD